MKNKHDKKVPPASEAVVPEELTAIEKLEVEVATNLAGWQRARADYENLQKEVMRERGEYVKFANAALLLELLPIYDNFKLAFRAIPEADIEIPWVVGLTHIKKQLQTFLENQGVEEIKTVGEVFDPQLHEAVETVAGDREDVIVKELKAGYRLAGRVIQAARVVVSKKDN